MTIKKSAGEIIDQLRASMRSAGIEPPNHIVMDGEIHRFSTNGKASDTAGWYVVYPDGIPAGAFGCWRKGLKQNWHADLGRKLTPTEREQLRDQQQQVRRKRDEEQKRQHLEAALKANELWSQAAPATDDHDYLVKKCISGDGLRIGNHGQLIVPMRDADGAIHSLQFISPDGTKRFLTGGRKKGCFHLVGRLTLVKDQQAVICIAEGLATAKSINQATGLTTAMTAAAFDAGNLKPVALALRFKYPDAEIRICADDDHLTDGNPGVTSAKEAARAVGGLVCIPDFGSDRPADATDFNDLFRLRGEAAVQRCIDNAQSVEPMPTDLPGEGDISNAARLVKRHGHNLWFTPERGWLVWNRRRWAVDDTGLVKKFAKETALSIFDEVKDADTKDERFKWAKRSQSAERIRAMISLAEPDLARNFTDFDTDPTVLNVANGVVCLKTGELKPHNRDLMLSKIATVNYHPSANAPKWNQCVLDWMGGNNELAEYIRRAVGYSLTGLTIEQVLFFCYGTGRNGKSVFIEIVRAMLGEHALACRTQTIMSSRGNSIPNDIARLAGARSVSINETADGQKFDEPLLKDLTGGDTIPARFLHREYFEFHPQFKLWIRGNHLPEIRGTDDGIWRRIHLIPFNARISDEQCDPHLMDKLRQELPGILAWAVRGCLEWQESGLCPPAEVVDATKDYRADMDTIQPFIDECCNVGNSQYCYKSSELYGAYATWAKSAGETPISHTAFSRQLVRKGYTKRKSGIVKFYGIELKQETQSWR